MKRLLGLLILFAISPTTIAQEPEDPILRALSGFAHGLSSSGVGGGQHFGK